MSKKVFIKTFGCQMNEYDSNRIYESVSKIGYEKTETFDEANCYIINTCHIRDKAKEKVYHEIGRVKKKFKSKQKPVVIVAGCVAQAENNEMMLQLKSKSKTDKRETSIMIDENGGRFDSLNKIGESVNRLAVGSDGGGGLDVRVKYENKK